MYSTQKSPAVLEVEWVSKTGQAYKWDLNWKPSDSVSEAFTLNKFQLTSIAVNFRFC